jgi:hypothetical protein
MPAFTDMNLSGRSSPILLIRRTSHHLTIIYSGTYKLLLTIYGSIQMKIPKIGSRIILTLCLIFSIEEALIVYPQNGQRLSIIMANILIDYHLFLLNKFCFKNPQGLISQPNKKLHFDLKPSKTKVAS